jgi:hypothetical protein
VGGKSSGGVASNSQLVQMQQQQAAQAQEQNVERNARLQTGAQQINDIFAGHAKGATLLDLSGIASGQVAPGAAGAANFNGYTWGTDPTTGQQTWIQQSTPGLPAGYSYSLLPDSGGAIQYGLYGPSGLITSAGSPADLAKQQIWIGGDPSQGTEGGIQPSFYTDYYNSLANQGLQDESQQYANARSSLGFQLARAGTSQSSWAAQDIANLAQQDTVAQARVRSQASTQEGALRTTEAQNQANALNQLYSTEDPTVAASTAENMVANADLQKTDFSPLGALFNPIVVGVGNAMSGFTNPYAYINPSAGSTQASTPGTGTSASGTVPGF